MIKRILQGGMNIWLNSIVAHIPSWTLRRMFYRMAGMKIEKNARIGIRTQVSVPRNIKIGARSVINPDCYLDGRGGLNIENDISISKYSKIITESHLKDSSTFDTYRQEVIIKHHAWIGMNAIILPGAEIGERAIIGAGCVFKGSCKPDEIFVGNPAKHIGNRRMENEYRKNYKIWFI